MHHLPAVISPVSRLHPEKPRLDHRNRLVPVHIHKPRCTSIPT